MGQDFRRLKKDNVIIEPKEVEVSDHGILFLTEDGASEHLDEDRILLVCIEDSVSHKRLGVETITSGTIGRLLLGTVYGTRCEIEMREMHKTAGELLISLVSHFPWLWVGDHQCLNSGKTEEWENLQEMVEQMRADSIRFETCHAFDGL
ncbi:hypothetical protein [Sellimonas sp.]|uniref:hypothetical protein n=1 Tax=Sellimonas sp. TaxID=2021466 RepID=UPI00257CC989|nr:hypothetical protein [Sellimonas sp.]